MWLRPLLVIAALTVPASARTAKVRTVEGVTEYRLDNGLQVLLVPDSSVATLTINLVIHTGARAEGYGETGMAHLIEHLFYKGSPRHRDISKLLESHGSSNDNGATDMDTTQYYVTLGASADNLDFMLDLYADVMANASISDDDLRSEFSVVRNELEADETKSTSVLDKHVAATAYTWHAYGRDVLGSRADIERVQGAALRAFYARYYQPDNATLILGGHFEPPRALAAIERTFGAMPRPTRALPSTYTLEPPQDGARRVNVERTGEVTLIEVGYHGVSGASPDYAPLEAATSMLGRESTGRLYKKLVETKLAAAVSTYSWPSHDPGFVTFTATVAEARNADRVEKIMLDEIEGLAHLDGKDLDRWRVPREKSMSLELANTATFVVDLASWIGVGDWRTWFAYRDSLARVTLADVARVAGAYFIASNRTVGRFVPTAKPRRAPLTETASVGDAIKGVREGGTGEEGEPFATTLDNIDARTKRGDLVGAIKTALLAKKTRHAKVHLELSLHWGDETSLRGQTVAAAALGLLMTRGTAHKTYEQLLDAEDRLEASIELSTHVDGLTLTIEGVRDQLGPALAIAIEMMTEPALTATSLDLAREDWIASLEQNLQDPESVAGNVFSRTMRPRPAGDPRETLDLQHELALVRKLRIADVKRFYSTIAGASHGELVVVGDFDAAAVSAQIEALAKKWPAKAPYKRLEYAPGGVAGTKVAIPLADKDNAVIDVGHDLAMRDTDPDYPALVIANQIFGLGYNSRLEQRFREKEGLSYGVSSWLDAGSLDVSADFNAYAIVAPSNLGRLEAELLEEFRAIARGPIRAAEVDAAKQAWLRQSDTSLGDDATIAALLRHQLHVGRDMSYERDLRAKIAALAPADIERATRTYLAPDRLIVVEVFDPAKK